MGRGGDFSSHPARTSPELAPPPPCPPDRAEEERAKQTTVVWQSVDPVWDEQLVFRDVCAASELVVEMWDLGGTRSSSQLNKLTQNPSGAVWGAWGGGHVDCDASSPPATCHSL